MRLHRCQIVRQHLYLKRNFFYFSQKCVLVSYFHLITNIRSFFNYRPSHQFSFWTYHWKLLTQQLVQLCFFRLFHCHLKMHFILSFNSIKNCNWSFSFFISYIGDDPMLYEAVTCLWFSPLLSLQIVSSFWGIIKITCFLLPAAPCFFIFGSSYHYSLMSSISSK